MENSTYKEYGSNDLHLNIKVGLLFASKPIVQLIANPLVGPLTDRSGSIPTDDFHFGVFLYFPNSAFRIGYSIPMLTGFLVLILSTSGNSGVCYFLKSDFS
jgi:hypothetical protein